jgi:hypothetical protein
MYERVAENPDQSLIASYADGIARLVDDEDDAFGLVIEGNVADHMTRKHCALYTVGKLQERFYAFAFPKGWSCMAKWKRQCKRNRPQARGTSRCSAAR